MQGHKAHLFAQPSTHPGTDKADQAAHPAAGKLYQKCSGYFPNGNPSFPLTPMLSFFNITIYYRVSLC